MSPEPSAATPAFRRIKEDILSRIRSGFPTSAAVAFAFDINGRPTFDGFFQPDPLG